MVHVMVPDLLDFSTPVIGQNRVNDNRRMTTYFLSIESTPRSKYIDTGEFN